MTHNTHQKTPTRSHGAIFHLRNRWRAFASRRPSTAQFILFFVLSNGMTVLQLILMPVMRSLFEKTSLLGTDFRIWPLGQNADSSPFYVFDYAAGPLPSGGGGLAYFLAVQITLAIAQFINFFAQRNITFRSNTNPWIAAAWYLLAYVAITIGAAAAQGVYKAPIYELLMKTWGWGATGGTVADALTMIINAAISFFVFFPIFKVIFPRKAETDPAPAEGAIHA